MARQPIDVDHLFTYHPPTPDQIPKFEAITAAARNLAQVVADNCPNTDRTRGPSIRSSRRGWRRTLRSRSRRLPQGRAVGSSPDS